MTAKLPISVCVIAMNEEDNIERCLRSLAFCDDLVVVDSHSTDRTRELAAALGARVVERDWEGFGPQKEHAVSLGRHDVVLCLDADEWVSDELRTEIRAAFEAGIDRHAGWEMPRLSKYMGVWIRRGGWYPDRQMRLYDRRKGRWGGNPPHERASVDGSVGRFASPLLHVPYRDLEDHLTKIDRYTSVMARDLFAKGRRASVLDLVVRPCARFLRFYLLKGAFTHGWVGLHLAYLDAHYVRMKYAKLRALQEGQALGPEDRQ